MNKDNAYVIGVDYGSDSVRSIIVNVNDGFEVASSVFYYPRWKERYILRCFSKSISAASSGLYRRTGIHHKGMFEKAGNEVAANVKAISVDTTGSTPVAVDKTGTPLALLPEFENNPNAMFVLWKDHTALKKLQK